MEGRIASDNWWSFLLGMPLWGVILNTLLRETGRQQKEVVSLGRWEVHFAVPLTHFWPPISSALLNCVYYQTACPAIERFHPPPLFAANPPPQCHKAFFPCRQNYPVCAGNCVCVVMDKGLFIPRLSQLFWPGTLNEAFTAFPLTQFPFTGHSFLKKLRLNKPVKVGPQHYRRDCLSQHIKYSVMLSHMGHWYSCWVWSRRGSRDTYIETHHFKQTKGVLMKRQHGRNPVLERTLECREQFGSLLWE